MSENLQNFVKFQKIQLENLVDFEKCCKTHIFLQKSEPIQPKTSNNLPKFCQPTLSDVAAFSISSRLASASSFSAWGRLLGPRYLFPNLAVYKADITIGAFEIVPIFRPFQGPFSALSRTIFAL